MNRAARATLALELRRGRHALAIGWTAAAALAAIHAVMPWDHEHPIAIFLIVLPGMIGFSAGFGAYGDLLADRRTGRLALERALPVAWFATAGARLIGAGVRATVAPAMAASLAIGLSRGTAASPRVGTMLTIVFAVWVVITTLCWLLMAANVRWSMLRLWWIPTTIWLVPQLAPREWWMTLEPQARATWAWIGASWAHPTGPVLFVVAMTAALALAWVGAAALYASGLRRYVYAADPLGLQGKHDPTRRALEYPPGPRSVIAAIALLDVRLGIERMAKQWMLFVILVVIAIAGPDTLRSMAPMYITVLGVMVPGAVVLGVLGARQSGALAAWQHLPHPRLRIAAGKLVSVGVLSFIGAVLLSIGRALRPDPAEFASVELVNSALTLAAGVWVAVVIACWWQRRYLLWLLPGALVAAGAWAYSNVSILDAWPMVQRAVTHRAAPVTWFVAVAMLGVPLFAEGLRRYQKA